MAGGGRFAIEITDGKPINEVIITLQVLFTKLSDMGPAIEAASAELDAIIAQSFATETSAIDGAPWDKLKKSTQEDRRKKGYGGSSPILVRDGTLREAALSAFESIGVEGAMGKTSFHRTIVANGTDGTNYAANMQYGTEFGGRSLRDSRPVPARPFIPGPQRITGVLNRKVTEYLQLNGTEYETPVLQKNKELKGNVYSVVSPGADTPHGQVYRNLVAEGDAVWREISAVPNSPESAASHLSDTGYWQSMGIG